MRGKRIQTFYRVMYDVIKDNNISDVILNTMPDSLDMKFDSFAVVELPYSLRDIDISDYDVKTSFARISFFSKDKIYNTSRMPNIIDLEGKYDKLMKLIPYRGDGFSLVKPRTVIPPRKASSHYHYLVVNIPVIFD